MINSSPMPASTCQCLLSPALQKWQCSRLKWLLKACLIEPRFPFSCFCLTLTLAFSLLKTRASKCHLFWQPVRRLACCPDPENSVYRPGAMPAPQNQRGTKVKTEVEDFSFIPNTHCQRVFSKNIKQNRTDFILLWNKKWVNLGHNTTFFFSFSMFSVNIEDYLKSGPVIA